MKTHTEMIASWKEDPAFRTAYDALEEEFTLFDELFTARSRAGLTQTEVAERMGTKTPAVARLEAGGGSKRHSPSLATLRKYAEAVGCHLEIKLVPVGPSLGEEGSSGTRKKRPHQIDVASTGSPARVTRLTAHSSRSRTHAG
jgi:transcriptional regulator with XRE-family HTH domain